MFGCHSVNKRMSLHLQEVHKIKKSSPNYYELLKQAEKHVPNMTPIKTIVEPRSSDETSESSGDDTIDTDSLLAKFKDYKESVGGGQSDVKTSSQSKQQIQDIMTALGAVLFDKLRIREEFLFNYAKKEKQYKAKTIKRYLLSLTHFYDFVLSDSIYIKNITPEDVLRMKVVVSRWSEAYNSDVELEQQMREMDEQLVLITPEQIQAYEQSDCVQEAQGIYNRFSSPYIDSGIIAIVVVVIVVVVVLIVIFIFCY